MSPARTRPFTPPEAAVQFRSLAFNADEWQRAKSAAHGRGMAVRKFVAAAVEAELEPLLASLGADQLKVRRSHRRLPMDQRVLRRLSAGRRQAGIPAVALLRLCLAQHAARGAEPAGEQSGASADALATTP